MKKKLIAVQLLFLVIFLACAGYLGKYFYDSVRAKSDFAELRREIETAQSNSNVGEKENTENTEKPPERAENGMLKKYYSLSQQNGDMVGWISIPGTSVDYPVMYQNDNNDYYLHRNFKKEYRYSGLPFLDYQCSLGEPSANLIIYAHNMKDGSMFAPLTDYDDKRFYESHKIIRFDTLYDENLYEVAGVFRTTMGAADEFKYYEFVNAHTDEEFYSFIDKVKKISLYDTGVNPIFGDNLLTLSTCSYGTSDERFVVVARKI